jgi:hypothetical protein
MIWILKWLAPPWGQEKVLAVSRLKHWRMWHLDESVRSSSRLLAHVVKRQDFHPGLGMNPYLRRYLVVMTRHLRGTTGRGGAKDTREKRERSRPSDWRIIPCLR